MKTASTKESRTAVTSQEEGEQKSGSIAANRRTAPHKPLYVRRVVPSSSLIDQPRSYAPEKGPPYLVLCVQPRLNTASAALLSCWAIRCAKMRKSAMPHQWLSDKESSNEWMARPPFGTPTLTSARSCQTCRRRRHSKTHARSQFASQDCSWEAALELSILVLICLADRQLNRRQDKC